MVGTGDDLDDVLALLQRRHGLGAGAEVTGEEQGAVVQLAADGVAGGGDGDDLTAVQILSGGNRLLVQVGAILVIETALAGVDAVAGLGHADHVVQGEVDVDEVVPVKEQIDVLVGILVAPDVQGAVIHQNGTALIAAGHLLDVIHVDGAVEQDVGLRQDVGVILVLGVKVAELTQLVVAPAVDLAFLGNGDHMVDTGGHIHDLGFLHLIRDVAHIQTGGADLGVAPDEDLAGVVHADGEAAEAVDHADIVLQITGHGHHAHGGVDVLLGNFSVGVVILGHEQRADEDQQEHGDHDAEGKHSELAL